MNEKQLKWLLNSLKMGFIDISSTILLENIIYRGNARGIYNDDGTEIIKWKKDFESLGDGIYTVSLDEGDNADYFLSLANNTTGDYEDIMLLNEKINEIFIIKGNQIEFEDKIYTVTRSTTESGEETIVVTETIKYLRTDNETEYTPVSDYNPVTKKYVDDSLKNKADKIISNNTYNIAVDMEKVFNGEVVELDISEEDYNKTMSWSKYPVINGANFEIAMTSTGENSFDITNGTLVLKDYIIIYYGIIKSPSSGIGFECSNTSLIMGHKKDDNKLIIMCNNDGSYNLVTKFNKDKKELKVGIMQDSPIEFTLSSQNSINNKLSFDEDGNLIVTIDGVSKKFTPVEI